MNVSRHNEEIQKNLLSWDKKPVLQKVYRDFYQLISTELSNLPKLKIVELGSGIGNIRDVIPNCIQTDLFPNPWIDEVENAYELSFKDNSISDLILFDVFHHLRYPGTALKEFKRVLAPNGHIIIFDPAVSLIGMIAYGMFHPEPIAYTKPIVWFSPPNWTPDNTDYYAAQGNATRIFSGKKYKEMLNDLKVIKFKKLSAISYVVSGGYSKPQLYPDNLYPLIKLFDRFCDLFPILFSTRLIVVLKK